MNERIRQLALQVGSTHKQNLGVYQFYTDELEKFVELIIRECAEVAAAVVVEAEGVDFGLVAACHEHFGIEE
jgi:hypothetical protein